MFDWCGKALERTMMYVIGETPSFAYLVYK